VRDFSKFFDKPTDPLGFNEVKISLASPEKIRSWSFGEVKKPETINYRTFKPERDGLFCAKIFGPVRDFECICGKYKRMKHRGVVCDKCGVEVIHSKVRRERLGHINLATPVAHIWFLKSLPSRIGTLLDMTMKDVERVLYNQAVVVLDPGDEEVTKLERGKVLLDDEYEELLTNLGGAAFRVKGGAEALMDLLSTIDIEFLSDDIKHLIVNCTSETARKKHLKKQKVVEAFKKSKANPTWMLLSVVPVLPPDLRPLVPLEGGRFATSDLNDLYRRVINRNNRLLKLIELNAPAIIVSNEKRMLQESVDALFDNGRRGKPFQGSNKRPLRSLSDMLKGKQGRFRQNLLGKRVDYSGRSVIVVGPELNLHQCGLPKKMAIELFKPFLYNKLEEQGIVSTIKSAKKLVEKEHPEVWDILDAVTREHPVMLNRAPTLHRLGIQAFEPVLIEGKAIRLHPLVCFAFNADFDGDQMAVHVPLSVEAQMEARVLMMSSNNILSPASGSPVIVPSQDIVLGCYYLTKENVEDKGAGKSFGSVEEVRAAYDHGTVGLQAPITVRILGKKTKTTVGRVILFEILPDEVPYENINRILGKKQLSSLVMETFRYSGSKATVLVADRLRSIGFTYSTKAGISISIGDMVVPANKQDFLDDAYEEVKKIKEQYSDGLLTEGERYNKVVDIWAKVTDKISNEMMANIASREAVDHEGNKQTVPSDNSIFMMADSGARGSNQQIRQLAGMRGLMAKPSGEIIETPITSNFREGLTVLQYFTSTHGARKGLADTALKTASSGYLTRRLVDVAQDCIVSEHDCETNEGIDITAIRDGANVTEPLSELLIGRVAADQVKSPNGEVLCEKDIMIDWRKAKEIEAAGIEVVRVRTPLLCGSDRGVCVLCYGQDKATSNLVNVGEAVGIVAAQSIGEPGTQLTMRTFHFGGTVTHKVENNTINSGFSGKVKFKDIKVAKNRDGVSIVLSRSGEIDIVAADDRILATYPVNYGSILLIDKDNQQIEAGTPLCQWDQFAVSIISEVAGTASYSDIQEGKSMEEKVDEATFMTRKVITDFRTTELKPGVEIVDKKGEVLAISDKRSARYMLPAGAQLQVNNGDDIQPGDVLAKIPRETAKTKDITGGLPRVGELFEARKPKDAGIMVKHDGEVLFGADSKGKRKVIVRSDEGDETEYLIPKGSHIIVTEGEYIRKGSFLVDGSASPHDILAIMGVKELSNYLVKEILKVYHLQGVKISRKHIEVIVRQMIRRVKITSPGDSNFLEGQQVDRVDLRNENQRVEAEGGNPALFEPVLLGITKASLSTESFISAASFQETTKVLTEAAIQQKVDHLIGLKENVIMGKLIPAGTGSPLYQQHYAVESELLSDVKVAMEKEEILLAEQKAESAAAEASSETSAEVIADAAQPAEAEAAPTGDVTT